MHTCRVHKELVDPAVSLFGDDNVYKSNCNKVEIWVWIRMGLGKQSKMKH